jgi:branched-chain amino acid aminotransferase
MVTIEWTDGRGWHDATLGPREPLTLDPAAAVLHYAQEIFEGSRPTARRRRDGAVPARGERAPLQRSADRMAMPELPEDLRRGGAPARARPTASGSRRSRAARSTCARSCSRPRRSSACARPRQYKFLVIATPAGNYFKAGVPAVSIWVSKDYTRAAPGGTGAAKCGGNYAASLVPHASAVARGFDQVCFLDAAEHSGSRSSAG